MLRRFPEWLGPAAPQRRVADMVTDRVSNLAGLGRRKGALLAAILVLLARPVRAEVPGVVVPTGRQESFVLGYEQHLYNMLNCIYDEYGAPLGSNRMNSVVSVVASADDQVVTYDHWEDGLDADPWSTTLVPGSTTLVLGDNDPTNGRACDWMTCAAGLAQGPGGARAALLAGWQSGVMATHYFGHGGLTAWADEQVLTTDDVAALGRTWKPTVLFTWACLSQYSLGVDGPSLNESLLLQPAGGALASFGPAGITPPARQAPLVARVYDELRAPGTSLGEAIRRAKAAAVAEQPSSREVVEGFHLFGDPALVLHRQAPGPR